VPARGQLTVLVLGAELELDGRRCSSAHFRLTKPPRNSGVADRIVRRISTRSRVRKPSSPIQLVTSAKSKNSARGRIVRIGRADELGQLAAPNATRSGTSENADCVARCRARGAAQQLVRELVARDVEAAPALRVGDEAPVTVIRTLDDPRQLRVRLDVFPVAWRGAADLLLLVEPGDLGQLVARCRRAAAGFSRLSYFVPSSRATSRSCGSPSCRRRRVLRRAGWRGHVIDLLHGAARELVSCTTRSFSRASLSDLVAAAITRCQAKSTPATSRARRAATDVAADDAIASEEKTTAARSRRRSGSGAHSLGSHHSGCRHRCVRIVADRVTRGLVTPRLTVSSIRRPMPPAQRRERFVGVWHELAVEMGSIGYSPDWP